MESALNEYKILSKIEHASIVKLEDFFISLPQSKAYLVMENGGSMTLDQLVSQSPEGKLPELQAK